MSTGFETTNNIEFGLYLTTSGTIDLRILIFLFTRSILVSPGFCAAPAVMITMSESLVSLYSPALIFTGFTNPAP